VALHCFYTSLTSWARNIAGLAGSYRVYAPDMLGQPGRSVPTRPIRDRQEMAQWLTELMDQLEVSRAHLVGYSYGGFAALNYAIREEDRIERLVLLSPAGGLVPLRRQFYLRGALNSLTGALLPAMSSITMRSLFRWMFYRPNLDQPAVRPVADRIFDQMLLATKHFRPELLSGRNFVTPSVYADEELRGVGKETLLLVGEKEALYDPQAAVDRARKLMPRLEAEVIAHAGHDLPVSLAEEVNRRILAFLR
jgi:pimeloyl-ACP methyl ester carboxylesterase